MPRRSRKSKEFTALDRLTAAASFFLRKLYPPTEHPPTVSQRNATIRARFQSGESQAALAREYGISYQRIFQIVNGKRK